MGLKEGIRAVRLAGNKAGRVAKVAGLVGLASVMATGCSTDEVLRFGWPEGITPQADRMRDLWTWSVIAALVVGVIVWGLILWAVAFHRKRSDEMPRQFQYNMPLEIIYTVIPTIIVVVLFYYTATAQNYVNDKEEKADITVGVVSFQWNWEFNYPAYKTPTGDIVRTVGNPNEIPLLVVPSDKVVRYEIRSTDVVHSFFVPAFNFKRDTFPHPDKNNQDNVFQNKIDRQGAFVGRCAELCGTYHAVMNFEVRVLKPEDFQRYIQLRTQNNPVTGAAYSAAEALAEMACGELCAPQAVTTKPFNTDRTAREASGGR